jgi:hypothetical protein
VTLEDPAEPRRSAAGGAFPGNSAIFDDLCMCPPHARPNYRSRRLDFLESYQENQMTGNLPYDSPYDCPERFIFKLYGELPFCPSQQ